MKTMTFLTLLEKTPDTSKYYKEGTTELTNILKSIISLVGGIGGLCFTLAVLIIAVVIIFGSISPRNIGKWWTALFSCVAGAALFFSAFMLSDVLADLFSGS
ncbi:TrbC/VirB2 family protein [Lysinibacillus fusiformis]|uniref:TrbC/VirB2 family protein n=1 Tax=Lysinibacillus fusiformis TaxID=28031 RepID=UPI0008874B52|nr:TrbC/VirB2 family protein [Lysinibacillus fusiformis]SCX63100.1 TrbC/VIRB2 family protein [Lysinibacillus fusiformis]SDB45591.1 TrbC/VIRB2 family protein [Lysinibacillus fusiformis]SFI70766.1 TrbC/VIRB2 family protein [Lysinibacillus fusiformis]SFT14695.1 TrbC/VIRB2 family protein [Lysinibacillus fusiformis]